MTDRINPPGSGSTAVIDASNLNQLASRGPERRVIERRQRRAHRLHQRRH